LQSAFNYALDDYITTADGTCVPTMVSDYTDFFVAYATLEIKRALGEPTTEDYAYYKELEADVKNMWAGRPQKHKINKRNRYFGSRPSARTILK